MFQEGSDLIPEVSSSNLLCPSNKKASCLREAADVDPQTLKFSQWVSIGLNYGAPRVSSFVYFWEQIKPAGFWPVHDDVSHVLFGDITIVKHLLNCL